MTRDENVEEWADEIIGCVFNNQLNREEAENYLAQWFAEKLAELIGPRAPLDALTLRKEGGGPWLGAARKWVQWHRVGGDRVTWGSETSLQPPITMRELEDIAAEVAAASMGGTRTEEEVRRAVFARWAAESKVSALRVAWKTTQEHHADGCDQTKYAAAGFSCTCELAQRQAKAHKLLDGGTDG